MLKKALLILLLAPHLHASTLTDRIEGIQEFLGTDKIVYNFDKIIITMPQYASDLLIDTSAFEDQVFSRIKMLDYKVTLAQIDNLPQHSHLWLQSNNTLLDEQGASNDGKPVLISSNQPTNVYQIYQNTSQGKNSDELNSIMATTIEELGGTNTRIITEVMYKYFPHFDAQAFKDQIPQQLEKLQGYMGTFYTGGIMDFEIVENAARHAEMVVKKYF